MFCRYSAALDVQSSKLYLIIDVRLRGGEFVAYMFSKHLLDLLILLMLH